MRLLEVGCGTGAVLGSLPDFPGLSVFGIDIDRARLANVPEAAPFALPAQADALRLPFPAASFDVVFCHFVLLWINQPQLALQEMARVARPGGWVLAMAEPDYGGRIDYPEALAKTGQLQAQALQAQGADPRMGRQLGELFTATGLESIMVGVLGGQWQPGSEQDSDWRQEWLVLQADLGEQLNQDEIRQLEQIDLHARRAGQRILFVPTFYACGQKPENSS